MKAKKIIYGVLFFVALICALGVNEELPIEYQVIWFIGWLLVAVFCGKQISKFIK